MEFATATRGLAQIRDQAPVPDQRPCDANNHRPGENINLLGKASTVAEMTMDPPMRPFLPPLIAFLGAILAACTPSTPQQLSHSARFPDHPNKLFEVFEESCSGPAQTYLRLRATTAECRSLMSPDQTAFTILNYAGTTDDLPQLVIAIASQPDGKEHLVTIQAYLNVPQKAGGVIHVVFPSRQNSARMESLLRIAGGDLE